MFAVLKQSDKYSAQVAALKSKYGYWDEWTSARWQRVENPDGSKAEYPNSILRYHPITGKWLPLTYAEAFDDPSKSS
jgi:hypothetical protein